jgi:DNA topoisomerase-1
MNIIREQIGKTDKNNKYNKKYVYKYTNGNNVTDINILSRITKLHIPPAWVDVNVSESNIDYLQVTGYDSKERKQYIYHPCFIELAKKEKYKRLENFIDKLPVLNKSINEVLAGPVDLSNKNYLVCIIVKILINTYSRIGNEVHTLENNTYGLTTLLKKHVDIKGDDITMNYIGKKKVQQNFIFKDEICSKILKKLKTLPGDRLFKTSDNQIIRSSDINEYLKEIMKGIYTSKDFRTYGSNLLLLKQLYKEKIPLTDPEAKKTLNKCCNEVAEKIGHTSQVSKTNYIYPIILQKYTNNPGDFIKSKDSISTLLKKFN